MQSRAYVIDKDLEIILNTPNLRTRLYKFAKQHCKFGSHFILISLLPSSLVFQSIAFHIIVQSCEFLVGVIVAVTVTFESNEDDKFS